MRLFIGIEVPEKIKSKISSEIKELKKRYPTFKWVSEKNFHITLLFLGEVNEKKLEKIKQRLERCTFEAKQFYLFSYSFGLFIHRKIVIYIGFRREKEIEKLAALIRKEFKEYTSKENHKKFIPHITIARARIPSKQQYFVIKKLLSKLTTNFYFKVDRVVLYESTLTQKGPIYKKLAEVKLTQEE